MGITSSSRNPQSKNWKREKVRDREAQRERERERKRERKE